MPDDAAERLIKALSTFEDIADQLTPEEAVAAFDDASLQVFWRDWPDVSSWAGALWRRLNEDLAQPASAPASDLDEVGGSE